MENRVVEDWGRLWRGRRRVWRGRGRMWRGRGRMWRGRERVVGDRGSGMVGDRRVTLGDMKDR